MFLYLGIHHVFLQNLGLKRNQTGSLLSALQCIFEGPEKIILYQKLMKNKQIFMKAKKNYCIIKKKRKPRLSKNNTSEMATKVQKNFGRILNYNINKRAMMPLSAHLCIIAQV